MDGNFLWRGAFHWCWLEERVFANVWVFLVIILVVLRRRKKLLEFSPNTPFTREN